MLHLLPEEEQRLIAQAQQGDQDAFGNLWVHFQDAVRGFIRGRTENDDDADEILQNTAVEILRRIDEYDPDKGRFYTWVTYWAGIMLMRFYRAERNWRQRHILLAEFSELRADPEAQEAISIEEMPSEEPTPEERLWKVRLYQFFLCEVIKFGGPPHQVLAFIFNRVLEYGPQQVVAELSDIPLPELSCRAESEYIEQARLLSEEHVEECFQRMPEKMTRTVGEVNPPGVFQEPFASRIVGDTTLRDYYGKDPEHQISVWSSRVEERVLKHVRENCPEWLQ